jgi:hypothetical protein
LGGVAEQESEADLALLPMYSRFHNLDTCPSTCSAHRHIVGKYILGVIWPFLEADTINRVLTFSRNKLQLAAEIQNINNTTKTRSSCFPYHNIWRFIARFVETRLIIFVWQFIARFVVSTKPKKRGVNVHAPLIVIILRYLRYSHHQPKGLLRELQVVVIALYDYAPAKQDHHQPR